MKYGKKLLQDLTFFKSLVDFFEKQIKFDLGCIFHGEIRMKLVWLKVNQNIT